MWRVMARTLRGRLSLLMASWRRLSWRWAVAMGASGLVVSVVKTWWRPCGLAGPQPKQWLARSSMVGLPSIEAGVWRDEAGGSVASIDGTQDEVGRTSNGGASAG